MTKRLNKRVVLASGSPRRVEILASVGLRPEVVPSLFQEDLPKNEFIGEGVHEYPVQTASHKAMEVYKRLVEQRPESPPDLVIAADTIVVSGDEILEKPADKLDNLRMLADLNGHSCIVMTGVAIVHPTLISPGFKVRTLVEKTDLKFADTGAELLQAYVDSEEGLDRAGGFAIQGRGALLIKGIKGDYNNVVGFPLFSFYALLDELIGNEELDLEGAN
ncbi:hypothetical protein MPSI1_000827 [Malassezia psittaci]|uniref:Maf-like protein n=1 Tax=Malassezia psittaci TaxID=1821823 RepID=A0AAF0FC23_9BASI|nr:hypothetical protein MPSI1_000827 [Malassezia psittaci]